MRLLLFIVVLIALFTVIGLLISGPMDASLGEFDRWVSDWMGDHRSQFWDDATWLGSTSADFYVKVPAALVLSALFLWRWRTWFEAVLLDVGLIVESLVFVAVSFIVDRGRPAIEQLDSIPPTGSFPSGHSAAAVVFYGAIAIIVFRHTQEALARGLAVAAAVGLPLIVAASRLYRGMHFFSDVVMGLVLGAACLWYLWRLLEQNSVSPATAISGSRHPKPHVPC